MRKSEEAQRDEDFTISKERNPDWPPDVYSISLDGLDKLGVHKESFQLYWDGKEIVTKRIVRLRNPELLLAMIASFSTLGLFIIEFVRFLNSM